MLPLGNDNALKQISNWSEAALSSDNKWWEVASLEQNITITIQSCQPEVHTACFRKVRVSQPATGTRFSALFCWFHVLRKDTAQVPSCGEKELSRSPRPPHGVTAIAPQHCPGQVGRGMKSPGAALGQTPTVVHGLGALGIASWGWNSSRPCDLHHSLAKQVIPQCPIFFLFSQAAPQISLVAETLFARFSTKLRKSHLLFYPGDAGCIRWSQVRIQAKD